MRYSREHVWIREEDTLVRIGLSKYAGVELGELTFIEFPEVGEHFGASDVLCSIDSLKAASDIYAPIAGTVIEVNTTLTEAGAAATVNRDPLGAGWLLVIKPDQMNDLEELLSEETYLDFVNE